MFNVAASDQNPEFREATLKLFERLTSEEYEGYTSVIVLYEIEKAEEKRANTLKNKIKELDVEVLENNPEIEKLAGEYIKEGLIAQKHFDDAQHIALASYYEMDAIVSWNFEHMVKLKMRRGIPSVNVLNGYKPIEIITPMEVRSDDA